jgi:hypothetical protein
LFESRYVKVKERQSSGPMLVPANTLQKFSYIPVSVMLSGIHERDRKPVNYSPRGEAVGTCKLLLACAQANVSRLMSDCALHVNDAASNRDGIGSPPGFERPHSAS